MKNINWVKVVNRESSVSFLHAIAEQTPYFRQLGDYFVEYFWSSGITHDVAYAEKDLIQVGKKIETNIGNNIGFAKENAHTCKQLCDEVVASALKLRELNHRSLSNGQLATAMKKALDSYYKLIPFLLIPHSVERVLIKKLEGLISMQVQDKKKRDKYFEWLTIPLDEDNSEVEDALTIAAYIKNHGWNNKAKKMLSKHTEEYAWLPMWGISIKPLDRDYFKKEIDGLVERFEDPKKEIEILHRKARIRKTLAQDALRELNADKQTKAYVHILQSYIFLRTYRKNTYAQAHYHFLPFISEVAKRMNLPEEDVKNLAYHEMTDFLSKGEVPESEILSKRRSGWAILGWEGKAQVISGRKAVRGAKNKYKISLPQSSRSKTVKGNVASKGVVKGKVKIVKSIDELEKVEKGDILVAIMTTPDYMSAIYRCGAIVTDEGGITCHAAIISREFNIPAIVGTGNATKSLNDGDLVKVDAENGIVEVL